MDIIIYGISYMLVIVPNPLPTYMMMSSVPFWFYWFWVGMLSWKYKDIVLNTMEKYKIYIPLILIYVLVTACFPIGYANQTWYTMLTVSGCIVSLNYILGKVQISNNTLSKVNILSGQSFGVYIWHYWIALMLLSNTSKGLFGLETLANNHTILFPLVFSLLTFMISWFISYLMSRTSIGKFLIG